MPTRNAYSRLLLPLVLILSFLMGPSMVAKGNDEGGADPASLEELVQAYGVEDETVDVLVVVDTSSSMSEDGSPPPWPSVVEGYDALVSSLGPHDQLGLITFSTAAALDLDFIPMTTPENRKLAADALPQSPQGTATDIGAAMESAVKQLNRPGAAGTQVVIFMTDGKQNPLPSSQYQGKTGPAWDELAAEGKELTEARRGGLMVYGWGAGGAAATDVDLVKTVFPDAEILGIPTQQLSGWLASLALRAERARVRPEVQQDLAKPISTELAVPKKLESEMTAQLKFVNPRTALPTNVDFKGLTVAESDGTVVPAEAEPQSFRLAPGQSKDIPVTLRPTDTERPWITIGIKSDERVWSVDVDATTSLSEPLATLLVNEQLAKPAETVSEADSPLPVDVGVTWGITLLKLLLIIALVVAALIALALLWRWAFIPPPLRGIITDTDDNVLMTLSGKKVVLPSGGVGTRSGNDAVRLFTKPRKGKYVYVAQERGSPLLDDQLITYPKILFSPAQITLDGSAYIFKRDTGS